MNSRSKLNIALLGLLLVLGLAIFNPFKEKQQTPVTLATLGITADNNDIIIKSAEGRFGCNLQQQTAVIYRNKTVIRYPVESDNCIQLYDILQANLTPVNTTDLSQFQFEQTDSTLIFGQHTLTPGMQHPLTRKQYIKVDQRAWLIDTHYLSAMRKNSVDFIARQLIPANFKIRKITTPFYTLTFDGQKWRNINNNIDDAYAIGNKWKNLRAAGVSLAATVSQSSHAITIEADSKTFSWALIDLKVDQFTLQAKDSLLVFHFINDNLLPDSRLPDSQTGNPPKQSTSENP